MNHLMKKALSMLVAAAMLLSLDLPAFAEEIDYTTRTRLRAAKPDDALPGTALSGKAFRNLPYKGAAIERFLFAAGMNTNKQGGQGGGVFLQHIVVVIGKVSVTSDDGMESSADQ